MPAQSPVQAVIFDWGGTLTPWHTVDLREQWLAYARATHDTDAEVVALADRVLAAEDAAWTRGRSEHSSARMDEILTEAGVDLGDARHQAAMAAYREFWVDHTFTDPQVKPLWQGLRDNGIRVGILSNTIWDGDYHRSIFERDGVAHLIDGEVYSSEIAWTKPHPESFRTAADAVGVAPERCVYVGDRVFEDVHGSQSAGMRGVLVPHSDIPLNQQVSVDATPDGIARELLDVLELVQQWNREPHKETP